MDTDYLLDNYVTTRPGQPYRLFPFGKIVKNGKTRVITPEYAAQFKLPHFRPAVKLGSHEDTTPAGGHIIGLEVRDDGLYAVPEWNEQGETAMSNGAYRYHSPEVLWDDGAIENPTDGAMINGPLILGDALLHMPHLGEATALYSIEPMEAETMNENVTIPQSLWDKFIAPLFAKEPERVEVKVEVIPDEYKAAVVERDELKAKITEQEQATAHKARVEKFDADLKATKADPALSDLLADLPEEKAEAIMKQFKALSEQINESALTGETGTAGGAVEDPKAAFNAAVLAISSDKHISYNAAFEQAKGEHADLFKAAFQK
jgi:hypothetical protein